MGFCSYCGAILEEFEVNDHNKISKIQHDEIKTFMRNNQRLNSTVSFI